MTFNIQPSKFLILPLCVAVVALVWWNTRSTDVPPVSTREISTERATQKKRTSPPSKKWQGLTDSSLSTHVRIDLARSIDTHLKPSEIDLLLASFTHRPPQHSREQWYVVLNEIMEQMRKKGVAADRLGIALTAVVKDSTQSEVTRDYAVQHLSQWIAPTTPDTPGESSSQTIADAFQAIAATVTDPSIAHTSIPGTALMALTANNRYLPEELTAPLWQKLDSSLTSILKGETQGSLGTKTTIIQSAALRGSKTQLPVIQQLARDEKGNPSMRLSSIAALGIYRSEIDRDYLTNIATGSTRYRFAAQSALKKLAN